MRRALAAIAVAAAPLATVALPAAAPAAEGQPPWRAAEQVRERLFDAQEDLLLDDGRRAMSDVRAARATLRGPLTDGLGQDAPAALVDVRRGLAAAQRAAADGDLTAIAAARGRVQAAIYRGSYAVTLAAVDAGDAPRARQWLLLRAFRTATRFTRPSADATLAVRSLARGRSGRAARLEVSKDLLDAYQSKLRELLTDISDAEKRGFASKRAEGAVLAAGYWPILRERYVQDRGEEAAGRTDGIFARLRQLGAGSGGPRLKATIADAIGALDGFTAAPFSPEEQARRAQQLVSFLELVPREYDDATADGEVKVQFEIQEAVAFRDGAESAFADLKSAMEKRDAGTTAVVERELARLRIYVTEAASGFDTAEQDAVEESFENARDALDKNFPAAWKESSSDSDFDLIGLTLDRMEAAAGAGQWKQAEQARLEAYGFFEFGPEPSLRSLGPQLVADVEGLVWYGAKDEQGYAQLIARKAPRRDFRDTRLAIDQVLEDASGTLGDSSSGVSVVTNSAVIVFREGLEAVLILAAVTAGLAGAAREKRAILFGVALSLVASAITWVLAQTVLTSLQRYGEKLEAIVGLVALGVLLLVLNWFYHRVYWTEHIKGLRGQKNRAMAMASGGIFSAQILSLVLLGFASGYREGFETVLFLQALELNSGGWVVLQGVTLGLAAVAAVAVAVFVMQRRLPYKRMLVWTGIVIGAVLLVMVGKTVRTMQGVGWVSIHPVDLDLPFWAGLWFGVFPTVETFAAQFAAGLFVIGSYYLAERMRKGRRRTPRPVPAASGVAVNGNGIGNGAAPRPDREPVAARRE